MEDDQAPPTREAAEALLAFLPIFEGADFRGGEWRGGDNVEGVVHLGWFQLSAEAGRFVQLLYADGWIMRFDWPEWAPRARQLVDGDELEEADVDTIRRLLTVIARQDRFVEGTIASAFDSGLIVRILRRLEELMKDRELG